MNCKNCWICYEKTKDFILLPEKEDDYMVPTNNTTYEIKLIDKFAFLYYTICNKCMTIYLDNYPLNFRKIMQREIIGR